MVLSGYDHTERISDENHPCGGSRGTHANHTLEENLFTFRKPAAILLMILALLVLLILACKMPVEGTPATPAPTEIPATREARETQDAVARATSDYAFDNYIIAPDVRAEAKANPDQKLIFSYEGENQSYHTSVRNTAVFYIDYDSGAVVADGEDSFSEPSGILTRNGTDLMQFSGWYHAATKTFQGKLTIYTEGLVKGTGDYANYTNLLTYSMEGEMMVWNVGGEWTGNVDGTSTLKQTWPSGSHPDEITPHTIHWEITGTPVD